MFRKSPNKLRFLARQVTRFCPPGSTMFPCDPVCPTGRKGVKVTVFGAGAKMGQFLAIQLKQSPHIKQVSLFDLEDVHGMVADLNHIDTNCRMKAYHGPANLKYALRGSDIVLIIAGKTWRPGMTSEDLFNLNVGTVRSLAEATAVFCPSAIMGVATRPVNCFVPLINEIYKLSCVYNPDKVIGLITDQSIRANSIVASNLYLDATTVSVPVIGGASFTSLVPVLSLARPYSGFSKEMVLSLTGMIRRSEPHFAEKFDKSPFITCGYAMARFADTIARGLCGEEDAVMTAFVRSNVLLDCKYFATQLQFGPDGVSKNCGIPKLSDSEVMLLQQAVPEIQLEVCMAESFMQRHRCLTQCEQC